MRMTPHPLDGPAIAAAAEFAQRRLREALRNAPRPKIRKGPKKHSVGKRRSIFGRAKAKESAKKIAAANEAQARYRAIVRAYWRGERGDLSGL